VHQFPSREDAVVADLLARWARDRPDRPFALFEDGTRWTYAELAGRAWGLARALVGRLGTRRGEIVASWLPNGAAALQTWFATNSAGCVYAPLNTAYRGAILETALELTRARVLVAHVDLVDRLAGLALPHLETVVVVGGSAVPSLPYRVVPFEEVADPADGPPPLERPVEVWDDMTVMLTSGTTGRSKAVRRTYVQYSLYTDTTFRLVGARDDDRFYVCAPMFHGGADTPIHAMLQLGGSVAITESFSASNFWADVRRYGCTVAWIHSAMSLFLAKQPRRDEDADNPLRLAMLAPLFPGFEEFAGRHGIAVYVVYGMTEMPCVFSILSPTSVTSLGHPADPGYEVRLVDDHDVEVERGTPGEMILHHALPWAISPGYLNDPEATAAVWRNGWFHTGDVFVQDADGAYALVDRVKDSIRRRGENVSSAEVETEILVHDDVVEAAVVGVAAELEEDILAFVVPRAGSSLTAESLMEHLGGRLPYFALPRYVHFTDAIPRSVALRPDKPALRALGIPPGAWDRETAGYEVRRERFGTRR
jgi:carnitine-CoA ligase